MAHGLKHTDCECCEQAANVITYLLSIISDCRIDVAATNEAEHMMDGFGPRTEQPSDELLSRIDGALEQYLN